MNDWAITTEGLGRRFGRRWAVRDLDLQVPMGSVFGLLGPNGVGKTTTINMLMGLLPATAGRMSVLGIDPARDDVAVRHGVAHVGNAECGMRSPECGVRNAECGMRSPECGVRNAECGMRSAECGVRNNQGRDEDS